MYEILEEKQEKAIICAVDLGQSDLNISIKELKNLINTAGATVEEVFIQKRDKIINATFVGSGKLIELREFAEENDIDFIVFDAELSPTQVRNISDEVGLPIMDRTGIILDIFAKNATTAEGKLQVELAELKYILPRLRGLGATLSRQGGQIGTRGPGETKLETDKRHIQRRIEAITDELKEIEERKLNSIKRREKNQKKTVSIVGYTNAGKSTLLNALTDANVLVEDRLFATLDTVTKVLMLPEGDSVLLSDTVGFIRNLPHHLIKSFKSTLNQIVYADLVLIVCDFLDPEINSHIEITRKIIEELGYNKEIITVYNKCEASDNLVCTDEQVYISAKFNKNLDKLLEAIQNKLGLNYKKCKLIIPYADSKTYFEIKNNNTLLNEETDENGYVIDILLDSNDFNKYKKYIK